MACENIYCIANYKGECAVEKCEGEIRTTRNIKKTDKENRKLFYEIARKSSDVYFKEEANGKENRT